MIFDEIKQTTQDAIFYLESLKSELNMLSMQHLSTKHNFTEKSKGTVN